MTDTPRRWDRLPTETPKAHNAFLSYIALGALRSVREAARQHHLNATSTGEISGVVRTTIHTWLGWSSKHKWVSRGSGRILTEIYAFTCRQPSLGRQTV